jgi:ABC-type antimicrobial peptide transport system ATPase subunit
MSFVSFHFIGQNYFPMYYSTAICDQLELVLHFQQTKGTSFIYQSAHLTWVVKAPSGLMIIGIFA